MDSDDLLTADEVVNLTDRKYAKHQIAWLAANGWKFEVSADGHPKVLRSYRDSRMGAPAKAKRRGPRLEGLAAVK